MTAIRDKHDNYTEQCQYCFGWIRKTLKDEHEAECSLNLDNILQRSAAVVEQEDVAMEESEEEPAQESNPLVTSLAARPEDSDTCSDHPSQFEEANSGIDEDIALEDQAMEESKDEPAQETDKRVEPASKLNQLFKISREVRPEDTKTKREFDRENAVVKDGYYICNICLRPLTKDHISR